MQCVRCVQSTNTSTSTSTSTYTCTPASISMNINKDVLMWMSGLGNRPISTQFIPNYFGLLKRRNGGMI